MKLEALIVLFSGASTVMMSVHEPVCFSYQYNVVSNSNSPDDVIKTYLYKEQLIDLYEDLVFDFSSRDHQTIIRNNIDKFCFDSTCHSYYNGKINLVIGKGLGVSLQGKLKQDICDESVIREKFYIFELFK